MNNQPKISPSAEKKFKVGTKVRFVKDSSYTGTVTTVENGWCMVRWDGQRPHCCCPFFGAWELEEVKQ